MIKKLIVSIGIVVLMTVSVSAYAPVEQQAAARGIAEQARVLGLPEDDPIIVRAQELWWSAEEARAWDRDLIAATIYHEAWGGCSDRHRELVGAVVLNRVLSDAWPNSVYEVLTAPRQYAVNPKSKIWWKPRENDTIWRECQNIADRVLAKKVEIDSNVVYQANFRQGSGVYEVHRTSYSVSYFCFGKA